MENLLSIFGLEFNNRLIFSAFCLLIAVLLIYFYLFAQVKIRAEKKTGNGLIFLAVAYVLYFLLGIASIRQAPMKVQLILSVLISVSFLKSLPFFSLHRHLIDHIVEHDWWRNGVNYAAFALVIVVSWWSNLTALQYLDLTLSTLALSAMALFVGRYFVRKGMYLLAVFSTIFFSGSILMQVAPPESLAG
ncbi:MAG: hypothetical protein AAFO94_22085, partial [Bacteroidota bacterium]